MNAEPGILEAIEDAYPNLSPRLQRAARHLQGHPEEVALYPLRTVASAAKVSPTTLVRLATDLGYPTYNALKDAFRDRIRRGPDRYAAEATRLMSDRVDQGLYDLHRLTAQTVGGNVESAFETVSSDALQAVAETLSAARTVYVFGVRSMFAPAYYFAYLLRTFCRNVVLVDSKTDMLIDDLGQIGPEDAFLVVSYEPYAASTVKAVELACASGADVVAMTDSRLAPVAREARHVVVLPTASPSFYQSLVPAFAILEALASFVLVQSGDDAVRRIADEFSRREAFGVYWQERG